VATYNTPVINLVCRQGSTFFETFEVRNNAGVKDITGYFGRGHVRVMHSSGTIVASFVVTVSDPTIGLVTVELTPDQTRVIPAEFPMTLYRYDVEIYTTTPDRVFRIAEGQFAVTPEVTR
jgi:hypothetical protein